MPTYDADGNRLTKTVVSGGPVHTQTLVKDVYQAGRIAYETDGAGTTLATFSYDPTGDPESVVVGSDPNTGPRYYYVYNTHGDVVALVDTNGNIAARYSYDAFGAITDSSETFANGWTNPYRYDGMDRVRYVSETGLYGMSVRAYDPALGRFISRDPQGRTPLVFATQPYAYAGNNPLRNIDPSGQRFVDPSEPSAWVEPRGVAHYAPGVTTGPGKPPVYQPVVYVAPCDSCKQQKDIALIMGALEHQRLINDLFAAGATFLIDLGTTAVDFGLWVETGDGATLLGAAADALGLVGDIYEVGIGLANLTGDTGWKDRLSRLAGPLDTVTGALHWLAAGAAFLTLFDPLGDLIKEGMHWLKAVFTNELREIILRVVAHFGLGVLYMGLGSDNQIDVEEAQLASASLTQVRQQCQTLGISGCQ